MSKQITVTLDEELAAKLERIVAVKDGTIEETAALVIAQYTDRYTSLVEGAAKAAEKYDR